MERDDFLSGDAWCRYKFERESKAEEIEWLKARGMRVENDFHDLVVFNKITIVVLWLLTIAELAGWI